MAGKLPVRAPEWTATGGEIDAAGVFRAAEDEGEFTITATCQDKAATVRVEVTKAAEPLVKPTPQKTWGTLRWSGDVPPRKWMTFYNVEVEPD